MKNIEKMAQEILVIADSLYKAEEKVEKGNKTMILKRESKYPYHWVAFIDNKIVDRDQYSNDLISKFEMNKY